MVFQNHRNCDNQLLMKISTADKERLKEFADRINLPVSALIRIAVNEFEKNYIENN